MRRKFFVKDLFDKRYILDGFHEIAFESFYAFCQCKLEKTLLFNENQTLIIPIDNEKDFKQFARMSKETYMCDKTRIMLYLPVDFFKTVYKNNMYGIYDIPFDILLDKTDEFILKELHINNDNFSGWSGKNRTILNIRINKDNYIEQFNEIITLYLNTEIRFFRILFDAYSFEEMKFGELHEFEFHFYHFYFWYITTRNNRDKSPFLELNMFGFYKTLFIDNELKIYINKTAFEENDILFDLKDNLEKNGNDIPTDVLEPLLVYLTLRQEFMMPLTKSLFVDFYQNKKVMGHINEVPIINRIMGDIFG